MLSRFHFSTPGHTHLRLLREVVAKGTRCSTLYEVQAKIIKHVNIDESAEKVKLYHKRSKIIKHVNVDESAEKVKLYHKRSCSISEKDLSN
jgi:DNA-binding sugar fermentation-stimulating protein